MRTLGFVGVFFANVIQLKYRDHAHVLMAKNKHEFKSYLGRLGMQSSVGKVTDATASIVDESGFRKLNAEACAILLSCHRANLIESRIETFASAESTPIESSSMTNSDDKNKKE